jgi:hypothetical protein
MKEQVGEGVVFIEPAATKRDPAGSIGSNRTGIHEAPTPVLEEIALEASAMPPRSSPSSAAGVGSSQQALKIDLAACQSALDRMAKNQRIVHHSALPSLPCAQKGLS